jgi:TetR/AcrR family transcriptional regulator, fatty acid metabolism regulator protein
MASDSPPLPLKKRQRLEQKRLVREGGRRPELLSLKERQRQEREQLILQAADELLLEKGYHETSIDEIAALVGISKGTVYLHFASKDDLVFALIERGMRQLQTALDAILSSPGTPSEKLNAVLRKMYAGMMSRQRMELVEALFRNPELHTRLMERREMFSAIWGDPQRRISGLLEEGKAAGEFDRDVPTPVMLRLFWSMLSPQHFKPLIVEERMPGDVVIAHLSRFFFKGVAPGGGPCGDVRSPVATDERVAGERDETDRAATHGGTRA